MVPRAIGGCASNGAAIFIRTAKCKRDRFIWLRPDGNLQAARGQARIPSLSVARELMKAAEQAGWGNHARVNWSS